MSSAGREQGCPRGGEEYGARPCQSTLRTKEEKSSRFITTRLVPIGNPSARIQHCQVGSLCFGRLILAAFYHLHSLLCKLGRVAFLDKISSRLDVAVHVDNLVAEHRRHLLERVV